MAAFVNPTYILVADPPVNKGLHIQGKVIVHEALRAARTELRVSSIFEAAGKDSDA